MGITLTMGTTRPVFETFRLVLDPTQPVSSCQTLDPELIALYLIFTPPQGKKAEWHWNL